MKNLFQMIVAYRGFAVCFKALCKCAPVKRK